MRVAIICLVVGLVGTNLAYSDEEHRICIQHDSDIEIIQESAFMDASPDTATYSSFNIDEVDSHWGGKKKCFIIRKLDK